jgi:hypothetical protein
MRQLFPTFLSWLDILLDLVLGIIVSVARWSFDAFTPTGLGNNYNSDQFRYKNPWER